jgi:hypothetical protein
MKLRYIYGIEKIFLWLFPFNHRKEAHMMIWRENDTSKTVKKVFRPRRQDCLGYLRIYFSSLNYLFQNEAYLMVNFKKKKQLFVIKNLQYGRQNYEYVQK